MHSLFKKYPEAIKHVNKIAENCSFSLNDLKYQYPYETSKIENAKQKLLEISRDSDIRNYLASRG